MKDEGNPEYIAECRARLEALGLQMVQPFGLWATWDGEKLIDFSAIDPARYALHAMRMAYKMGLSDGEMLRQEKLRAALGL